MADEEIRAAIVLHLKRCGYVDFEDGCVPIHTSSDGEGGYAWTPVESMVDALLAKFEIRERA